MKHLGIIQGPTQGEYFPCIWKVSFATWRSMICEDSGLLSWMAEGQSRAAQVQLEWQNKAFAAAVWVTADS